MGTSMNVYVAMGRIVNYAILYLDIVPDTAANNEDVAAIAQLLDAYAELAPDWAELSAGNAEWYVIEPNGDAYWCPYEPTIKGYTWTNEDTVLYDHVDLPRGIDWRLCKWQRPEVTA